jgi:hypothetical protein
VINRILYKRYDAKEGRPIPLNAIKCQEKPDPITGHLPCWVPCGRLKPEDKWFFEAMENTLRYTKIDVLEVAPKTYEAIGPHFNGNPHGYYKDILIEHGCHPCGSFERSFEGIRSYLGNNCIEGIVFWKDGVPQCKIKRRDFGFPWPVKK